MTAERALAAFDMDGTLLDGRFVYALAGVAGVEDQVRAIQESAKPGYAQTEMIAALFAGLSERDFVSAIESIPLAKNCARFVSTLRSAGFVTGIISDSYTLVAGRVAKALGMDFVSANELQFRDGVCTGKVSMPMGWEIIGCTCRLSVCKRYHLESHCAKFNASLRLTLAIGDTKSDVCMIRRAKVGVAFSPKDGVVRASSKYVFDSGDFADLLPLAAMLEKSDEASS